MLTQYTEAYICIIIWIAIYDSEDHMFCFQIL